MPNIAKDSSNQAVPGQFLNPQTNQYEPTQGSAGSPNSNLKSSDIVLPVQLDSHVQQTIQTHNAVSIPLSNSSVQTSFLDANGFSDLGVTLANDATTSNSLDIYWSNDGTTIQGAEYAVIPVSTSRYRAISVPVKARYFKLAVNNLDSAAAHTMSAWAYLKA